MNICLVTWKFPYISNSFILNQAAEIKKNHNLIIISKEYPDESIIPPQFFKLGLDKITLYIHDFDFKNRVDTKLIKYTKNCLLYKEVAALPKIAELLKEKNIDVIHAAFGESSATIAMLLSRMTKIPFTFELHAWDLFVGFNFAQEKIKESAKIFTISHYNRRHLIKRYKCPPSKIIVKRVAFYKEFCDTLKIEKEGKIIVSACRLHPIKGLEQALRVFQRIAKRHPDSLYYIIGEGPLRKDLEEKVRSLGLSNRVIFTGLLSNEDTLRYISRASAFILPSRITSEGDRDGIPTAMIEAMYLMTPVIGTRVSGITELVDHGVNGFLTSPGDIDEMANLLDKLLRDGSKFGKNARAKIEDAFDIQKNMELMYREWLANSKKRPQANIPDSFCAVPFMEIELNSSSRYRPCCKFQGEIPSLSHPEDSIEAAWLSDMMENLRQAFLKGERPKECWQCWMEESCGMMSRRKFIRYINQDINYSDLINDHRYPMILDIKLSNLCNMKCRICGPESSSLWSHELSNREGYSPRKRYNFLTEKNLSAIQRWLPYLRRVEITGGEPLLNDEFYSILDLFVKNNVASKISIHCNSNGTIFPKKSLGLFSRFKEFSIGFSIDDTGKRFEYQRYPGNWEMVKRNLEMFRDNKQENFFLWINCTVSIFNVYYLPEFLEWSRYLGWKVGFNVLHNPSHFNISILPSRVKRHIISKLSKVKEFPPAADNFNFIISFLKKDNPSKEEFKNTLREISKIDRYRAQSFKKTFPEFYSLIKDSTKDNGLGNIGKFLRKFIKNKNPKKKYDEAKDNRNHNLLQRIIIKK